MPYKHGVMQNMIDSGISKPAPKYSHLALPAVLSILACTFSLFQPASAILTTCYDASGAVRPDVPCYQDAVNSACCGQGWVCTNVSLCIAGPTVKLNPGDPEQFEGSCTDITWNSPACPSFCRNGNLTDNIANGLWNCSGGNYCCSVYSGDTTCCQQDEGVFYLGDFVNITTIGGAIGPGFSTSTAFSSTGTSATIASTTATIASTTATIASTTASTPAASSSSPASNSGGSGLGEGAKAGIGIGVTLGVIILAAFAYLTWRNRKATLMLREQVRMLAGRNEIQKDTRYESSGIAPYHDQERYELDGLRNDTAELPAENERIKGNDARS